MTGNEERAAALLDNLMSSDLRKTLSLPMLAALGAAGVVGSSWIFTTGDFFRDYGSGGEVFGLVVAAALAVCVALAYAELASRFPRAGGEIVFAFAAFGRGPAFVAGWLLIGAYVSSLAFYITASGMLLTEIVPGLKSLPLYSIAGETVYLPVLAVGVGLCCVIWLLAASGMAVAGGLQLGLFAAMLCIGFTLAFVGFAEGRAGNFWPAFPAEADPLASTVRFVLPALTFLTGFSLIAALAEDADLPPRRIGAAVVAAVVIAAMFYCTVLLATAWLIPWQQTAQLEDGVIGAFRLAGHPVLAWGAFAISVLGLLTSFLALFPAASRLVLALARASLFPPALARLGRSGRPTNALLFTLGLTLGTGLLGRGALLWFLDNGGVYIGLAWCLAVWSLYRLRRAEPLAEVPFHARPPWLPALGAVAALCVILGSLVPGTPLSLVWPAEYLILGAWVVLGAVIYRLAPRTDDASARAALLGAGDLDADS